MYIKSIFAVCLIASIVIMVASQLNAHDGAGLVSLDPSAPHQFLRDGSAWQLAGCYPALAAISGQGSTPNGTRNYYKVFIDKLSANKINYFRNTFTMGQPYEDFMVPYLRTGPGTANDGMPKFDLTKFNQTYFDYWRDVIAYAQMKDIVVQVCIFDSWHTYKWIMHESDRSQWGIKHDFYNGWNNINGVNASTTEDLHNPQHPAFEHRKALIRKVVESIGDFPNIIYEISNENHYNIGWEIQLADYLTEYETSKGYGPHLVMPRDLPNHDLNGTIPAGFANEDYSINNSRMHDQVALNFFLIDKPIIVDNDGGGIHYDADAIRERAWAALTAGGYLSYFHYYLYDWEALNSNLSSNLMKYIGLTRTFIDHFSIDKKGMQPRDDLVNNGWCLAEEGKKYIIYLPSSGDVAVSGLPESYEAYWFNPRDGSAQIADGGPIFSAPDSNDWTLYIHDSSSEIKTPREILLERNKL